MAEHLYGYDMPCGHLEKIHVFVDVAPHLDLPMLCSQCRYDEKKPLEECFMDAKSATELCLKCEHPLDAHVLAADRTGDPLDGGTMTCPEGDCICLHTWQTSARPWGADMTVAPARG